MTTTQFYNPQTITQEIPQNFESEIPPIGWNFNNVISENNYAMSTDALHTISGLWMEKYVSKTNELWCTNLQIPNLTGEIVGIEVRVRIQRKSRIEDSIIQLTHNGMLIGDNQASQIAPIHANMYTGDNYFQGPNIPDDHIYGDASFLWGTENLTFEQVSDPSFGFVIGFRSNQEYPHRDLACVEQIGLRITYV